VAKAGTFTPSSVSRNFWYPASLQHNGGQDGHAEAAIRFLTELRAASIFFHADDSARAANGEAQGGQAVDGFLLKSFVNIPHRKDRIGETAKGVKQGVKRSRWE
jgi:hypothetical protein